MHTPGPWKAEGWKETVVNDSRGTTIALHPGDSREYGLAEVQANARLIAAAPDLLAACKLAVARNGAPHPNYVLDVYEALEAAILKAEEK